MCQQIQYCAGNDNLSQLGAQLMDRQVLSLTLIWQNKHL